MEKLYKEYSKLVFYYLNSLSGNSYIAEELTQETFYKAIKGINKFNNECKISTWLCKIAKNTWNDYLRKDLFPNYIENRISDVTKEYVKRHIKNCKSCADILNSITRKAR